MTDTTFLVRIVMNTVQKSPKGSTVRVALGPSSDGKWRSRRPLSTGNWRTEMTEQIEKKMAEKEAVRSTVAKRLQDSIEAAVIATQKGMAILNTLLPCPSVQDSLPLNASAPKPYVEVFTAEEIETEQKWIEPLVSFSES